MKMRFGQFLLLDSAGALLYTTIYILVGYVSRDFLAATLRSFYAAGRVMEVLVVDRNHCLRRLLASCNSSKYRSYDVVPRIQAAELAARLAAGGTDRVQIVDVRSHGYYDIGAERIHGSIRIEPNNLDEEIKNLPKDEGHLSVLYLSARSDQRPGGASTAGKRIQHVRDRRRTDRLAARRASRWSRCRRTIW